MTDVPLRWKACLVSTPLLLLLLGLNACSRSSGGGTSEAALPLFEDILTLEASIEEDPALDDFQIVYPQGIGVDAAGNIYLADEHSLKVYRPDGSPLKLLGRDGAGPGEFRVPTNAWIGPTGYITAKDVLWDVNIYAADGEFVDRVNYRTDALYRGYLRER